VKSLLGRLATAAFGLLLAAIMLEFGLRFWFSKFGSEQERIMYIDNRATINQKTAEFVAVPFLNFTLNPAQSDISKYGYRGADVEVPKPQGVYRIVVLGGSTTFGTGLKNEESWPYQLQQVLRTQYGYEHVEVINLGVPSYYSLNSLINLETHGLALQPDLVIDNDAINDAVVRMYQDPQCYSGQTPLIGMGMDQGVWQENNAELPPSTLYRFLAIRFKWMKDPTALISRAVSTGLCPPEPQNGQYSKRLSANIPVYFERNLRNIAAISQAANVRVVMMSSPWNRTVAQKQLDTDSSLDGTRALIASINEHNKLIPIIAQETNSLFVDVAAQMLDEGYFQGDQIHQTPKGTQAEAQIVAVFLDSQHIIPK
jgi:lysophospholipase L1-like esterase